jgi:hypothetical protein
MIKERVIDYQSTINVLYKFISECATKCFQMYKKFSGHIIIFPKIQLFSKFTFSYPENYLNSPENLLQIYLNLPKSALEIYLKFLMSNYQGCGTTHHPPVSFKQTLSD